MTVIQWVLSSALAVGAAKRWAEAFSERKRNAQLNSGTPMTDAS